MIITIRHHSGLVKRRPPGKTGSINPGILYTMHKMEVDEIYCIGGAQAIGALAYGTDIMSAEDLIIGPGNQFVMEAKRQVFGTVARASWENKGVVAVVDNLSDAARYANEYAPEHLEIHRFAAAIRLDNLKD